MNDFGHESCCYNVVNQKELTKEQDIAIKIPL